MHYISRHLDHSSRESRETSLGSSLEYPTFKQLEEFVNSKARALERIEATTAQSSAAKTQPLKKPATAHQTATQQGNTQADASSAEQNTIPCSKNQDVCSRQPHQRVNHLPHPHQQLTRTQVQSSHHHPLKALITQRCLPQQLPRAVMALQEAMIHKELLQFPPPAGPTPWPRRWQKRSNLWKWNLGRLFVKMSRRVIEKIEKQAPPEFPIRPKIRPGAVNQLRGIG
ncbi:hypothetical protein M0804_011854 [Polistes exclamans]|nr:hypothetical protein M0804_011854 [Polistes exclamans]